MPCCRRRGVVRRGYASKSYILGEILGQGAMGVVRKASPKGMCKNSNDVVAIKSVRLTDSGGFDLLTNEEFQQLLTEIEITFECKHPNIIRTRAAYQNHETLDIVMDLAAGGEVAATFAESATHSELKAQNILKQVCAGLAYLHEKGIAHRDVKPENVVYVDETQRSIVLVDFGFASRDMHDAADSEQTQARRKTLVGTAPFLAPELFDEVDGCRLRVGDRCVIYDTSVDMWAAGVFTFLLLFGVLPFAPDGRFFADFKRGVQEELVFPAKLAEDFSSEALAFIRKCLDKRVAKRLTAAQALRHRWFRSSVSSARIRHFGEWQQNMRTSLAERRSRCSCPAMDTE
eukprot:TRINITY_DN9308_c1_g3_i1.p1 TRINITY_DN9308_c1_g3~~TRINITY_DN9308_c1_g3_i1.p1  ORF type:complete len:345 (+),score=35.46 TRINITY_DN9308_c1_g3_i1:28-1062(+)